MTIYMDYPFYCDEKLGDRCGKQCMPCKEFEAVRWSPEKRAQEVSRREREIRDHQIAIERLKGKP